MPTVLTDLPLKTDPPRKVWTRAEYDKLSAAMLNDERLELVNGELISKMGKKRPHVNAMVLLHAWLQDVFGFRFVQPEAPIDVAPEDNPTSEPEPDIIVTRQDLSYFKRFNPGPADVLLVVEISHTTLGFDLTSKARLYARAAIADYWVLDVSGRRLIVHRDPRDGKYASVTSYKEGETVAPLAAPDAELRVETVLAP
ncbi:MAG: Uma2 family endonuclease [Bryobacteraceae bacterium]|nr:Uma2 family endonuclease [Bryobacteraceae bacterium]